MSEVYYCPILLGPAAGVQVLGPADRPLRVRIARPAGVALRESPTGAAAVSPSGERRSHPGQGFCTSLHLFYATRKTLTIRPALSAARRSGNVAAAARLASSWTARVASGSRSGRGRELDEAFRLTTLREKLIKIGAKVVRHAKYVTFQMAEVAVPRELFAAILERIQRFGVPPPLVQRG